MQKHKGLLRIDLRNNASGFSGVLQMLPKQSISAAKSLKNTNASNLAEPSHAEAAVGISNHSTAAQQTYLGSDAAKAAAVTSRKGLTPVMTTDGHTPLQLEEPDPGDQSEKENSQCSQVAKQPRKGRSKAGHGPAAAGKPPCKAKRAKQACTARSEFLEFEFAAQPQHADDPSTTSSDFLEFGFTSQHELQFQPSDDLTGIGNAEKVQQEPTHTASQQGWYPPVTAVANDMAGSASFGLWARSQHEGAQPNAAEPNTVQSVAAVRLHQHTAADSNAQFDSSMSHEGSTNPASTYDMPPVRYSARVESPHGEDFLAHDQMQTEDQQGLRQQSHLAANPVQYTSAVQDEVMEPTCLNASTCWGCQQHQAAVTSATARGPTSTGNAASAVHSSKGRLGACQPMSATPGRQASVQPLSTSAGKQASLQPVTAAVGRQASTQPMSTSAGRQAPVQPGAAQQRQAAQGLQQTSAESRAGDLRWNSEQPITVWPGHHAVDVFTAQLAGFADPSTGKQVQMGCISSRSTITCVRRACSSFV